MGEVEITTSMELKKPIFKKGDKPLAIKIHKRKAKKR